MIPKRNDLRVLETVDDVDNRSEAEAACMEETPLCNVNKSKNGTIPTVLKVYEWFHEASNTESTGLTRSQLNNAVRQGKAAVR